MTRKAAIIGGGVIGGGWAARFLLNGWDVSVHDPDPEAARKIGEVLDNARRALPALYDTALPAEGRLSFDPLAEAVAGADWIQESVPERLELKHRVYGAIQRETGQAGAVLASSTSGFTPSQLQEGAADPGQILVAHPFNPVYLLPLVELVPSPATRPEILDRAQAILRETGFYPLHVRKEIDAHIADRFLEAVWREALWLVRDGIATTEEIDEAIRMGFGLRWAQMGLFETYRIAGGEAGMRHFIEQFGPALKWPWTRLMDVPELTDGLIDRIAGQSDAQSGALSIRALERLRDDNLVGILRALRRGGAAAGQVIAAHEAARGLDPGPGPVPVTVARQVPGTWVDYNGHMNEVHYLEAFSQATDRLMELIGADAAYVAQGGSYFTAETHIRYLDEVHVGARIEVRTRVLPASEKKLHLFHEMHGPNGLCATGEHLLLHVDLETRRSCPPGSAVADALAAMIAAQAGLPPPEGLGRAVRA